MNRMRRFFRRSAVAAATVALASTVVVPAQASTDVLVLSDSYGGRTALVRVYYTDQGDTLRIDRLSLSTASHPDIKYIKGIKLTLVGKGTYNLGSISRTTGVAVGVTVWDPSTVSMTGTVDVSLASDWSFYDAGVAT